MLCEADELKTNVFVEIDAYDLLRASPPKTGTLVPFEGGGPLLPPTPAPPGTASVKELSGREVSYSTDTRTLRGFELPNADWL